MQKRKYKYNWVKTLEKINARLNDWFEVADFKKVIDVKTTAWKWEEKTEARLRPETLFWNKFESYLNERVEPKGKDIASYVQERSTLGIGGFREKYWDEFYRSKYDEMDDYEAKQSFKSLVW